MTQLVEVPASASPHLVTAPHSSAKVVDPEEAYVAALATCQMLWFLSIAVRHALTVDRYRDESAGATWVIFAAVPLFTFSSWPASGRSD